LDVRSLLSEKDCENFQKAFRQINKIAEKLEHQSLTGQVSIETLIAVEYLSEIYRSVSVGEISADESFNHIIEKVAPLIDVTRRYHGVVVQKFANAKHLWAGLAVEDQKFHRLVATPEEIREARGPVELAKEKIGRFLQISPRSIAYARSTGVTDLERKTIEQQDPPLPVGFDLLEKPISDLPIHFIEQIEDVIKSTATLYGQDTFYDRSSTEKGRYGN
jgi:hypothetical protein